MRLAHGPTLARRLGPAPRLAAARRALAALVACGALALPTVAAAQPGDAPPPPRLIVVITVDQLRPDYFDRFRGQLTGGLRRLAEGGAVFTRAYHDHANTETAPGHAAILSGRFPRSTGILTNEGGVEDPATPLIGSSRTGASPFRFRGSALFDWLRLKDPLSRALSVSRKDRGAILPIGRAPQEVYWYGYNGRFVTSTYYHDTLPGWVQRFNERRVPQRMAGRSWTLLLPDSAYPEPDSVAVENGGIDVVFPHVLPADTTQAASAFVNFPWMDELTLDFALEGVREMALGAGPRTDVLAVSLSTTDEVGHDFGPDSRELHDQVLRLDRSLGSFLDSLYALRDSATVAVALTADHGVAPYPALHTRRTGAPARVVKLDHLVARARARLRAAGVDTSAVRLEDWMLFVERDAFGGRRALADSLVRELAAAARREPGVLRVQRSSEIAAQDTVRDVTARRWAHMLAPDLPIELVITLAPYHVRGNPAYAQHGAPYDYDAHVPVIFYGPWFRPGRYTRLARVVDIAPTLARVAGVRPTERLDGRVLVQALR